MLNPNFKIYYTRSWDTTKGRMYDVGSHTEFFLMSTLSLEELNENQNLG